MNKNSPKHIKILGTGKYLPPNKITAEMLASRINVPESWIIKKSGVHTRHFVQDQTHSQMGAWAAKEALKDAALSTDDIDAIISAGSTVEQLIPFTAALIHRELGISHRPIATFDVNATCLGFVTAFDLASCLIQQGRFKNILIIASEVASKGLDWEDHETCTLFGDGAAAVVVGYNADPKTSKLLIADMKTYSEGADYCQIAGGGMGLHSSHYNEKNKKKFLFQMDGPKVFKLASAHLEEFTENMLQSQGLKMDDIKLVIPHQASAMAMKIIQKKLNLNDERFMKIIENHGNLISASIPFALHLAIKHNKISRGDLVMLLGTSAGLCLGGAIFEY